MPTVLEGKLTLEAFYNMVFQDPALQDRARAVQTRDEFIQLAVSVAQERGYEATYQEIETAIRISQTGGVNRELTDEELSANCCDSKTKRSGGTCP